MIREFGKKNFFFGRRFTIINIHEIPKGIKAKKLRERDFKNYFLERISLHSEYLSSSKGEEFYIRF